MRTGRFTSPSRARRAASNASSAAAVDRRAAVSIPSPAGVKRTERAVRSNSNTLSSASSRWIIRLSARCETYSRRAAAEKFSSSATATKYVSGRVLAPRSRSRCLSSASVSARRNGRNRRAVLSVSWSGRNVDYQAWISPFSTTCPDSTMDVMTCTSARSTAKPRPRALARPTWSRRTSSDLHSDGR
jgi:hypothetical protein